MFNSDASGLVRLAASSAEMAAINTVTDTGEYMFEMPDLVNVQFWMALGASREINVAGNDSNDNTLNTQPIGYEYTR